VKIFRFEKEVTYLIYIGKSKVVTIKFIPQKPSVKDGFENLFTTTVKLSEINLKPNEK